jgi:hypothetical protein
MLPVEKDWEGIRSKDVCRTAVEAPAHADVALVSASLLEEVSLVSFLV